MRPENLESQMREADGEERSRRGRQNNGLGELFSERGKDGGAEAELDRVLAEVAQGAGQQNGSSVEGGDDAEHGYCEPEKEQDAFGISRKKCLQR